MLKQIMLILCLGLLGACTPPASLITPSPDSGSIPTREGVDNGDPGSGFGLSEAPEGVGFVATIDGDVIDDVLGEGTINCENGVYVIRAELSNFPQIALILPTGASPDTFTLVDNPGDGSAASATVFLEDGRVFAVGIEGILVVNNLATQVGQPVTGSFDFSASSGTEIINARGEFDFIASQQAVFCP